MSLLCLKTSNGFPARYRKHPNSLPRLARPTLIWSCSFSSLLLHSTSPLILLWPHSPSLVPWTGSAHSHFPTFALAGSSHAGSTLSLRSQFICHLLRETVPDHALWKPLCRHLCLTVVSLFFIVPSIHIWNDLLYLLAGSLIRIWTSRQQGLFGLSLYPNLAHGRYSTTICLLIYLSFRIKECYSWRGPGKPCTQVPPAIDEEGHDGQVAQSRSMVGGLNCWYSYGVWSQIDAPGGNYLSCKHIANTFQEGKQLRSRGTLKHWGFRSINRSCPTCYSLRQIHTEVNHDSGAKYSPSCIDYQERNLPLTDSTS